MSAKLFNSLVVIAVLSTLSNGAPIDEKQQLEWDQQFLAHVNGTTCFSGDNLPALEAETHYDSCIPYCTVRDGTPVCYLKCSYAANMPPNGQQNESKCQMRYICMKLPSRQRACSWVCV